MFLNSIQQHILLYFAHYFSSLNIFFVSIRSKPCKLNAYAGKCDRKPRGRKHLCVSSGTHSSSRPQPTPPPSSDRDSKEEMSDPWKTPQWDFKRKCRAVFLTPRSALALVILHEEGLRGKERKPSLQTRESRVSFYCRYLLHEIQQLYQNGL